MFNKLDIKGLIKHYGLNASKSLGQNYIIDTSITDNIVKTAGNLDDTLVIEIGPGVGTLTNSILSMSNAPIVLCLEKDEQFKPILEQLIIQSNSRLHVIYGDAIEINILEIAENICITNNLSKIVIIANLPYNIGTTLFCNWLEKIYETKAKYSNQQDHEKINIQSITVMLQKEVVDRIVAVPGNKSYGWLSIFTQWLCHTEKLFDVSPEAFWPQPKIFSSILYARPRKNIDFQCTKNQLKTVCQEAFKERRKLISNSLKKLIIKDDNNQQLLEYMNLNTNLRPEEIPVKEFIKIASMLNLKD